MCVMTTKHWLHNSWFSYNIPKALILNRSAIYFYINRGIRENWKLKNNNVLKKCNLFESHITFWLYKQTLICTNDSIILHVIKGKHLYQIKCIPVLRYKLKSYYSNLIMAIRDKVSWNKKNRLTSTDLDILQLRDFNFLGLLFWLRFL